MEPIKWMRICWMAMKRRIPDLDHLQSPSPKSKPPDSYRLQLPSHNSSEGYSSLQAPLNESTREARKTWHPCLQLTDWQVGTIDESSGLFSEEEITQLRHDILTQAEPVSVQIGVEVRLPDTLQEDSDVDAP